MSSKGRIGASVRNPAAFAQIPVGTKLNLSLKTDGIWKAFWPLLLSCQLRSRCPRWRWAFLSSGNISSHICLTKEAQSNYFSLC